MRIRGVIFDAGGTLIYPDRPVGETYARFAGKYGLTLPVELTNSAFREALQSARLRPPASVPTQGDDRAWWKAIVRRSLGVHSFKAESVFDDFFEEVYLHYAKPEAWGVFPEVLEVLRDLRDREIELAVLSNWDARLHPVLDGHGLGDFFSQRFISAELGWEKPDPAIYRHVADRLRFEPERLLSVGDDLRNDVEGPRRAGWRALRIERPKRDLWSVVRAVSR